MFAVLKCKDHKRYQITVWGRGGYLKLCQSETTTSRNLKATIGETSIEKWSDQKRRSYRLNSNCCLG